MFEQEPDYPVAVASYDDEGLTAAIEWCVGHLNEGDTLTVWTSLKSNLSNCRPLELLVQKYSDVEHITGRGGRSVRHKGPVLMAWAGVKDIAKLVDFGHHRITALCVISWNEEWLKPWVAATSPTLLGDTSIWGELAGPEWTRCWLQPLRTLRRWSIRTTRSPRDTRRTPP